MTLTKNTINKVEFRQDVEAIHASAQNVYAAAEKGLQYQKAWDDHLAVLDAFVAKYGSLRIGRLL